jgi:uncharacterized protein (TIGR00369 family)
LSAEPAAERPPHVLSQLGMRDVAVDGVDLAIEIETGPHLANSRGALQGGLIATLIDIVGGRLALQGLPSLQSIATSDLTVHYLAPVVVGPARAQGRVLRRGRRSVVIAVEVHDVGADRLAAVSTIAFAVLRPAESDGTP